MPTLQTNQNLGMKANYQAQLLHCIFEIMWTHLKVHSGFKDSTGSSGVFSIEVYETWLESVIPLILE